MTLRDIERAVYRRLNKNAASPNAETQQRIRGFINSRHRQIIRAFPQLRDETTSFATVASQARYALPDQGVSRINRVWATTGVRNRGLEQRSLGWLREHDANPQTGTPWAYIPIGYTQVATQPTAAAAIFAKSTSASDVGRVYIEGTVTGGYRRTAAVTLTGVTAIDMDTTVTTWEKVEKFYLDAAAVGTVTLNMTSGAGAELSRIAIGDTYARYFSFYLYPTPPAVATYGVDFSFSLGEMEKPLDEPMIPEDFHDLLATGARLDEYEHTDDARRRMAEVEWDEGMKALTLWVVNSPSLELSLNREPAGFSQLGPSFPIDSYRY